MKSPNSDHPGPEGGRGEDQSLVPDPEGGGGWPIAEGTLASASERARWFATTHWSVVLAVGQAPSPQADAALEALCRTYWYPLYAYVRRQGHSAHDAQDLTQAFFARLLEKDYLSSVEREKGKFRSFLLASLNHFLSHERARARAAKRGGGKPVISLDETDAESRYALEPVTLCSPETAFEKQWAIALLERAFGSVREEFGKAGKSTLFERLRNFLADGAAAGDYSTAAKALNMSANAVAVAVHRLRQKYRDAVRLEVAQTVASPDQVEEEMRHLFAALTA